ncbi:TcpQ domain-containing protein [Castellaniella sp.]|uniref:TcpQ domain-containing protein n=1 Tax=Castellaniella sp. TaxID=1955812 RepID=UPI002AFF89E1|nr:TcpQ domain-containing protein [Castellaniella sp.]
MMRMFGIIWLAASLTGCVTTDGHRWWREMTGMGPATGTYHFDWRLSGDPDLAPLQVFDDGRDTWLQYPVGQSAPALFARTAAGDRLLRPRREGDYLVVSGVHDYLLMRGGLLQAEARRQALSAQDVGSRDIQVSDASTAPATSEPSVPVSASPSLPVAPTVVLAGPAPMLASAMVKLPVPAMPIPLKPVPARFEVTPADGNVRRALARWARTAGWAFDAEHWAVDVDIPLAGSAVFDEPFRGAVRSLLAATELGDRPLQPCFYANQVLRVVSLAQRCDRTQGSGVES